VAEALGASPTPTATVAEALGATPTLTATVAEALGAPPTLTAAVAEALGAPPTLTAAARRAAVDTADDGLDDAVKGAGKALDAAVDENHDDPRWKRYVGKSTPKKIAAMGLDAELKVVQSWPESLKTEPEKALRAHAAPLAEAVAQGTAAVAQREQAQARRRDFMARDKAKLVDAFNDLRLDAHADLTKMVVPHKLDRGWPDRFFRKGSNAKADAPAAPTPVG
jgi:hypothetical protein